jgi:uncharacterized delta-60 repeat protein
MWFFSSRKAPRTSHRPRRASSRPHLEALEDRCLLSAGALDPTFGAGAGYVTTSLSSSEDTGRQVLVQPSGNIVVAGQTSVPVTTTTTSKGKTTTTTTNVNAFGVATYNPDGSLNTAFGSGGTVRQLFAGNAGGGLITAALEPMGTGDSKILLVGHDQAQTGMALMRLNANGTLDTTFGTNGQVVTYFPESVTHIEDASGVAVTSSGQILAVGYMSGGSSVLLARYNPNGSLDTTFGSNGTATTVFSSTATNFRIAVTGVALQPDGKVVVAGGQYWSTTVGTASVTMSKGMVLRYDANGSLDTSFGSSGVATTQVPFGSTSRTTFAGLALYPNAGTVNDGKIVTAGSVYQYNSSGQNTATEWVAVRYNANGSLDTTFGNGAGYTIINNAQFTAPYQHANAIDIESDGKPILAGTISSAASSGGYSQVARLNADGSLDATFGNGGLVTTPIGGFNNNPDGQYNAVALQPDGKIVAAGYASNSSNKAIFSLARYLPSEPEVGSFTVSPNPVLSGSSVTLTASNITDGNANSSITQVAFYVQSNGTSTLLGYGTQTSPGDWTLISTVSLAPGSYTLFAQAQDSYGVFGDPFPLTLQVQ